MSCFMSPVRSAASDTSIPMDHPMDQFPLGGYYSSDQKWYYSKDQQCAWLDPFVEAMEIRASAECALLQAAGLPTSTWHECNGSLGPDVIQYIRNLLVPSKTQRDFRNAAWTASMERDCYEDYVANDAPGDHLRWEVPATAHNGRLVTDIQKDRKVRSFMAALELRLIRLNAHSRWVHECMRRLNFDHRVQAYSVLTDAKHKHLECVSWFSLLTMVIDKRRVVEHLPQLEYGRLSALPTPCAIAVGRWRWGEVHGQHSIE